MIVPTYAGHLTATHIGEYVTIEGHSGRLVEIRHSERYLTVRVVLASPIATRLFDLDPRQVVS
jgi:hypothetical protein